MAQSNATADTDAVTIDIPETSAVTPEKSHTDLTAAQDADSFDVLLPPSLTGGTNGECNVLIQIDPEEAAMLDYDGVSGAIGRFQANETRIGLDLNGSQYQGSILPGNTCMLISLSKGHQLKVEGVTDEFATIIKTQDTMAKLDAIVTGAQLDDGYKVVDVDVNRASKEDKPSDADVSAPNSTKKRGASGTASKPTPKRRKSANKSK